MSGTGFFFGWIGLQIIGFLILLILGIVYFDKRYGRRPQDQDPRKPRNGFLETQEVFIDPADGHRYRVYYNPRTGERDYVREDL